MISFKEVEFYNSTASHGAGIFIIKEKSENSIETNIEMENLHFENLISDSGSAMRVVGDF